jgi:hypothetical protein
MVSLLSARPARLASLSAASVIRLRQFVRGIVNNVELLAGRKRCDL